MSILFALLIVLGFAAMLATRLPNAKLPEWPAWALWLAAALLWAWPVVLAGA